MERRSEDRPSDDIARTQLAERTRIAQELHDTLLQGFLAVSMQMQAAVEELPEDSPAKRRFGRIADLISRVLDQGRLAVQGLRATSGHDRSLAKALAAIPMELGLTPAVQFRVLVAGNACELDSSKWEDVYHICREAIVNAYRHSGSDEIEASLDYRRSGLRITVRDSGCGFNSEDLQSKLTSHWGLSGMRVRAERIGAELCIMSGHRLGTEVQLLVPAIR